MAAKFYGDFYADAGGVEQVGKLLTKLVNVYDISMDPSRSPTPYFEELMGNWIIPSMHLELGTENPVFGPAKREGKPKYVARVIQAFHSQLMGMLGKIKLVTSEPEAIADELLRNEVVLEVLKNDLKTRAKMMEGGKDNYPRSTQDAIVIGSATESFIELCKPSKLSKLRFNLTDENGIVFETTIDNKFIHRPKSAYYGYGKEDDYIPLACIAWALLRITESAKLLPDLLAPIVRHFAGTQEGLTTSMKFLLASLNPHLPKEKTIHNYLMMDGKYLTKIVQEESHQLQILFATRRIEGKTHRSIGQFIKTANIDPFALSLNPEFLKRDVACLIYSTREGLHNSIEALDGSRAPRSIETVRGLRDSRFSTTIEQMEQALKNLADKVYGCSSQDEVIELLKANSLLFKDADARAKMINSQIIVSEENFPNTSGAIDMGLNIIKSQLVPDLDLFMPSKVVSSPVSTGYALKKPSTEIIHPS